MVALVLILAAFGVGVGVGIGQGRGSAPASPRRLAQSSEQVEPASRAHLPRSGAGRSDARRRPPRTAARRALQRRSRRAGRDVGRDSIPFPTATPQDKSTLPDEAPIDTALLNEAWKLLKEQYYGNLPEGEDVTYAAIRGIISSLGDKHTAFLDPQQAESFNTGIEGQFEGIGAGVGTG